MRGGDQAFPLKQRKDAAAGHQRDKIFRKALGLQHHSGLAVADGEILGRHFCCLAFREGPPTPRAAQLNAPPEPVWVSEQTSTEPGNA